MIPHLIVIGASAGGIDALQRLLGQLQPDFAAAIAIVLHLRDPRIDGLLNLLGKTCLLPVQEARHGAPLRAGHVALAPGDYHLLIERSGCFALSHDEKVCHARPSIDVLFSSAADALGDRVCGIILSGGNDDGARGLATIRAAGGRACIQQPADAQATEMPLAALLGAGADLVDTADGIGRRLNQEPF